MESYILTKENLQSMIEKIRELTKDRKYWIGIATSRIESVEDPSHDWFRGVGTFERIVYLSIHENHLDYGIEIQHLNAVDNSLVVPESGTIRFGNEIIFNGSNDLLYFNDSRVISPRGGTHLYMEWTVTRDRKYSH